MNDWETSTPVVLVRNLSFNVHRDHLEEIFSEFGDVESVECALSKGHSLGYALVRYFTHDEAVTSISFMHGGNIDGLDISVELADPFKYVDDYQSN